MIKPHQPSILIFQYILRIFVSIPLLKTPNLFVRYLVFTEIIGILFLATLNPSHSKGERIILILELDLKFLNINFSK